MRKNIFFSIILLVLMTGCQKESQEWNPIFENTSFTILSLDDKSGSTTYNNMKALGEHINLMLEKGDLVISGIEFNK